ncbi:MAG TPA: CvpA family protein [Verrucomicrobiae bacterium]|nr:CvpA family protein [Verrucomicrobiae bacterium]
MSVLDYVVLAYVGFGVIRGLKRGLFKELPAALGIVVFFVTGCGLYRWTGHALAQMNHWTGQGLGVLSFIGLAGGVIILVRRLRAWLGAWAEHHFAPHARWGGAIVGGLRTFVFASVMLLVLIHWPLRAVTRPVAQSSLLGRALTRYVLPLYDKTHGAL